MPHPEHDHHQVQQQALRQFTAALRRQHRDFGEPAHRKLAAVMGYSTATVTRLFRGEDPPKWAVVLAFLQALGTDPGVIEEYWRPRWAAMKNCIAPLPTEDFDTTTPDPQLPETLPVCETCGAVVADAEAHDRFHELFVPRQGRKWLKNKVTSMSA